jgi:3-oxocholest-4-en-26-oate---CoA ligase
MRVAHNIADLFEHAADAAPGRPALKVNDRVLTYADLDADANRLAHFLSAQGVRPGDHVALYARNGIEHVIGLLAILKIRAASINVNYRYVESELDYLFDNADVVAVLHERCYAPLVARCAPRHEKLHTFVALPDVTDPECDADVSAFGGVLLEDALAGRSAERDFVPRSGDDLHIIYTGGTTGFPKGVMWRQEDFWRVLGGGIDFHTGERLSEYDQSEQARQDGRLITFPLSPLMHGGAQTGLLIHLFAGHLTILEPKFDPVRTWEIVEHDGVQLLFMTGDAMARPLIEEFERKAATGTPYRAGSVVAVASTAAIFSPEVKGRWLDAFPSAFITDSIGATETGFQGVGVQDSGSLRHDGALVALGPDSVVISDDNEVLDLASNVGTIARLGRTGNVPVGYYNDPEKSAATFLVIDGVRYSVPGDWVRVEADRKVTLLGRGSNCVNTGGEKVYPEEVEAAIKAHPAVYDCLVVGIPDDKYGQAVAAVVELRDGRALGLAALRTFLRASLSGYKLPRSMTLVDEVPRNPAGKAQYPRAMELALAPDQVRQTV